MVLGQLGSLNFANLVTCGHSFFLIYTLSRKLCEKSVTSIFASEKYLPVNSIQILINQNTIDSFQLEGQTSLCFKLDYHQFTITFQRRFLS